MKIIGIDPSLGCTGLAGDGWTDRIESEKGLTKKPVGYRAQRLGEICGKILSACEGATLVVIEEPARSKQAQPGHHESAGLWWAIVIGLHCWGIRVVQVGPSALKFYATGNGSASKEAMREAQRLWLPSYEIPAGKKGEDEVDALWLSAMGHDHAGRAVVRLPARQRAALEKVTWW